MPSTEEEKIPFIAVEGGSRDHESGSGCCGLLRSKYARLHQLVLALHLISLAFNVNFFILNVSSLGCRDHDSADNSAFARTFSPAESALQHITVEELHYEHGPSLYTGEPRPELDQAWSHLLRSTLLRITMEEMERMNKTSLALLDGSGYVGYLETFHMLHCVKRIYQSYHPSHYPEQQSDGAFTTSHFYHCLDVLREGIMCNADVTINTLFWENSTKVQGARPGPRKCIDWDRLQAWADGRTLTASDRETFLANLVVPFDNIGSVGPEQLVR